MKLGDLLENTGFDVERRITDPSHPNVDENAEPLLINTVNSWSSRPHSNTEIPNLFLASDYVRTYTDLATMEGANEAGRRATNHILDAENSKESRAKIFPLKEPFIFAPLKGLDFLLFKLRLPAINWHFLWWIGLYLVYGIAHLVSGLFKLFGSKLDSTDKGKDPDTDS